MSGDATVNWIYEGRQIIESPHSGAMTGFNLENIWINASQDITTGQKIPGSVWK